MNKATEGLLMYFFGVTPEELGEQGRQELRLWLSLIGGSCFTSILMAMLVLI